MSYKKGNPLPHLTDRQKDDVKREVARSGILDHSGIAKRLGLLHEYVLTYVKELVQELRP